MDGTIEKIIILGPTASGKSALAIELALRLNAEIISADSRQCYKYLDIGTAKPSPDELKIIPHHNISILEPEEHDSAAKFRSRALQCETEIHQRGKKVICAGGSTLHLRSIISPLDDIPDSDPENIKSLSLRAEENGLQNLYKKLEQVDPGYAAQMDGMNRQRIFRALDVWMQTGKPFSSFHSSPEVQPSSNIKVFGLDWPRKELYNRINNRVDEMIKHGIVKETEKILSMGFSPDLQSLQSVGYRQVIQHLNNEIDKKTMIADIKTQTRRYAKRQLTWFRKWNFIHWLPASGKSAPELADQLQQQLAAKPQKG